MIAAMKAAVARYSGDAQWAAVRPPLVALSPAERDSLLADLDSIGFSISGL
jgi:4-hydroxy-tetrahydrodipicolinate synthase